MDARLRSQLLLFSSCVIDFALSLDNGVARTPPMGWLSWERFGCETNCDTDPHNCISAQLYKDMADMIVADGWKEAGYEYVNVDDCWVAPTRDAHGLLQADEKRFPGGIAPLCQYIHERGLKCGLYTDIGATTCGGYLSLNVTADASNTQYERDMDNFASWGIDSLKVDGCNQDPSVMNITYPRLSKALVTSSKNHGRPILYSCSWPAYISIPGNNISDGVYKSLAENCNIWRNWADIDDEWGSVKSIINWWKVGFHHTNFIVYDLLKRQFVGGARPTVFKGEYTAEVACNAVRFLRLEAVSTPAALRDILV